MLSAAMSTDEYNSSWSSSLSECGVPPANVTIPAALDPVYATLEVVCAVLSIVGNSVIIFLFVKKRSLRTVKNCYVISLASADLLVALVGIPSAVTVSVGLPRDFHACLLMTSVLMLLCTASILSLVAVTVDRFWSIMRPLTYPVTMTHSRARAAIFVCWFLSTVIGLLPLFGWHRGRPVEERCFFVEVTAPEYLLFIFFGTIVVPTIFMAVLYFAIFCEVGRQTRKLSLIKAAAETKQQQQQQQQSQEASSSSRPRPRPTTTSLPPPSMPRAVSSSIELRQNYRQLRRQLKTVKSIFVVVVVFLVSWYPLYALNAAVYFRNRRGQRGGGGGADDGSSSCIPSYAFYVTIVLSHFNSVWNPILYGWQMNDFRLAVTELVGGGGGSGARLSRGRGISRVQSSVSSSTRIR